MTLRWLSTVPRPVVLDVACASRERLAPRHVASGARVLSVFPDWITMADPTGRLYCLTVREPETGRPPEPR